MTNEIQAGNLVRILADRPVTDDGITTAQSHHSGIILYEKIDLSNYPSYNDFFGSTSNVTSNDVATVIRYVGRPLRIRAGEKWNSYDVYEILVDGEVRQVFRNNIAKEKCLVRDD